MDNKFKVIMSAKEAEKIAEECQERAYQDCEEFLIDYISRTIASAASEGKSVARIYINTDALPSEMGANKVVEHLASPLHQLGYECRLSGDLYFDVVWGNKRRSRQDIVEDWEDVPF